MKLKNIFLIRVALLCMATLLICMPTSIAAPAASATAQAQVIQSLEDTLFSVRYEQDNPEQRVGRLEETVFGQKQTGALDSRVSKLKSVLSTNALGALSPTASQAGNAPASQKNESSHKPRSAQSTLKPGTRPANPSKPTSPKSDSKPEAVASTPAPGETDYPTVSQMEQKIFNKTFANEDITVRLPRLEKEVFKVPQSGALADRVDNLRLVVLGDVGNGPPAVASYTIPNSGYNIPPVQGQSYTPPQYGQGGSYTMAPPSAQYGGNGGYGNSYNPAYNGNGYPGSQVSSSQSSSGQSYSGGQPYYGQPAPGNYQPSTYSGTGDYQASYQPGMNPAGMANGQVSPDMLAAMDEVEKQVIGHTYPSDPLNARLDRLETKVFHATSPELPSQERMQRVIAVASAGGAPSSPQAKAKSTFQTLLPIILTILPLILL